MMPWIEARPIDDADDSERKLLPPDPKDERIAALAAELAHERKELADCTRDCQRVNVLLAEEEDATEALTAALRALVAKEPTWESDWGTVFCAQCDGCDVIETPDGGERQTGRVAHAPDCPWVAARTLLAEMQRPLREEGGAAPGHRSNRGAPACC